MEFSRTRRVTFADSYLPEPATIKRLARAGARDGARHVDRQAGPSATEREIAAEYGAAAEFRALAARRALLKGIDEATRHDPLPTDAEAESIAATWSARLAGIATKLRARLADQWNEVTETEARLNQFKLDAGIDGNAVYPESKVSHYGSLFLIGLGEAAANSWFYGSASPDGLGAGLLQAAVVSTVLVGAGAMAGTFAFRSCFSLNPARRAFGLAGAVIYTIFALFISLAAASFRDALAGDIDLNGHLLPIREILVSPAGLSFEAITLFAFAVMASGLAVFKGFTSDSAVPGHGHLDREYRRALAVYKSTWNGATDEIKRCSEAGQTAIEALAEQSKANVEQRERAISDARSAISDYDVTTAMISAGYDYAVKVYRDAADVIDPGTPWPAAKPLHCAPVDGAALDATEEQVAACRARLERIRSLAADASASLNDAAARTQVELETYRAALEAIRLPGTAKDSPKLRVVAEQTG